MAGMVRCLNVRLNKRLGFDSRDGDSVRFASRFCQGSGELVYTSKDQNRCHAARSPIEESTPWQIRRSRSNCLRSEKK